MADVYIIHENLRVAMQFFGQATSTGSITQLPGGIAIYCGLNYGVFNIAMLDGHHSAGVEETRAQLNRLADHFAERKVRWSFWFCEDMLPPSEWRDVRRTLVNLGMRSIANPPGMSCADIAPATSRLPKIDLRPVKDPVTRLAFAEMTSLCFEIPFNVAKSVYCQDRAWDGAYQGFVAYANQRPVSMCALVATDTASGIYSLATHPSYRRQGYGEAMMRAAIKTWHTGGRPLVLQSTEAGYSLYRRMGFKDAGRFSVYLTK